MYPQGMLMVSQPYTMECSHPLGCGPLCWVISTCTPTNYLLKSLGTDIKVLTNGSSSNR